ncbi:MAG TPA: hypothetical protein PLN31_14580 [Azoarcus taiwanensis]|nr:hypothetical protein [Azoarcus taiwanensis]
MDRVGPVREQELFRDLFAASKPETLVVVKGEHGTGKSQLINWLKLRFDDAIARGERSGMGDRHLRSVLIRRESGSLKDALQQLIKQLPEYQRHLAKIQAAITGISGEAANRRLYTEMHHCLFATRDTAPRRLRYLDQLFNDNGAVLWLCRPQGAIDRNIKRLTEQSDASARESLPPFTAEDFNFPVTTRLGFDEELKERLADNEELRDQAASRANEHLRLAIAGLTGLRGHTLNEIFREIREEMQRRGEALALFVEDVSTLSVLDEELVNALQPLNDPALCPLLSVLGMTLPAYNRLPDNLKGRTDRVLELSADSSLKANEGTSEATDRFVARYLNGLRAGPHQARLLADDVRYRGDQQRSACEDCSLKSKCFEAFGFVRFGEAEVGLYPLAPGASSRLLSGLNMDIPLRTPRTLLQHVVLPLLGSMATEFRGGTVSLSIQPRSPRDLSIEQDRMLVGWTAEQRGRISYLLYYWTGYETLAEGAAALSPMLPWFRHPSFSQRVMPVSRPAPIAPIGPAVRGPKTEQQSAISVAPEASKKYDEAIARLDAWFQQGRPLERDTEFRQMLAAVVNRSLSLEEVRVPSQRIQGLSAPITASNIEIEGMIRKPAVASKARFTFIRSQEVYELLKDLVGFEYPGRNSWRFPGGEDARRRYGHWLANRTSELVKSYDITRSDRETVLRAGIRFLRLAYRFSLRKDLPSDRAASVEAITSFSPTSVFALGDSARAVAADLPQRLQEVRTLILEELAVRQGGGGLNYIDPRPLIEHLSVPPDDLSLGEIDVSATTADYPAISRLASSNWARLDEVLKEEHEALYKLTYSLGPLLRHWSLPTESIPEALREYLESARAVIKACEGANESLGDDALQTQIRGLTPVVVARHVSAIERAVQALDDEPLAVLTLDIAEVNGTVSFIACVDKAIQRLQQSLGLRLSDVVTEEEVKADRQGAMTAIRELMALGTDESIAAETRA